MSCGSPAPSVLHDPSRAARPVPKCASNVERVPFAVFAGLSLALHAAAFGLTQVRGAPAPVAFQPTSQPLAGETLEVDPPAEPSPADEAEPTAQDAPIPAPALPVPREVPSPAAAHASRAPSPAAASAAPASAGTRPALFGAVGVRFATDLATTFTRAFPQAASADGVWASVPFGSAGTADVTLVLDDAGRLTGHTIAGAPSPALRRGVERTLALLGPRTFTARGAMTRLRVTARVGRDDVHDGLHGDVFALSGGSFSGDVGTAFFALPPSSSGPGRRVDVELRLLP